MNASGSLHCIIAGVRIGITHCFPRRKRKVNGYIAPDWFDRPPREGLVWLLPPGSDRSCNRKRPIRSRVRSARPHNRR